MRKQNKTKRLLLIYTNEMNYRNSRRANKLVISRQISGKYKGIAFGIHSELELELPNAMQRSQRNRIHRVHFPLSISFAEPQAVVLL